MITDLPPPPSAIHYTVPYTYDENDVRYELVSSKEGDYNWLFFPGGPGCDSGYLRSLASLSSLPGKVWLIDLPGNGTNQAKDGYDFEEWFSLTVSTVKRFDNPVFVGHSFGGYLAFLAPELEENLKGLVILNSSPSLRDEESARVAKENNLPDVSREIEAFNNNPTDETLSKLLRAYTPYYFLNQEVADCNKTVFENIALKSLLWWLNRTKEKGYRASWVPENLPTLIICSSQDYIVPPVLFKKDKRFNRTNIHFVEIEGAGHYSWLEKPGAVKAALENFALELEKR